MWAVCFPPRLPGRAASRLCQHSKQTRASSSSSQSDQQRPKAEKRRRRREREEAVFTGKHNTSEDAVLKWSEKQKMVYSAHTSAGAKKDTSLPFPPTYSPEYVEPCWYEWWEKEGFFKPEQHDRLAHAVDQTFSLCIPPPNVTGTLHVGHALTVAVEDALVRWRRMQGHRVLWVPGCDHAGIATQTVVERKLFRETGKRRQDFSREEFMQEVWNWKNEKGDEIYHQLRSLGASLDWSRACFTLDPGFSRAVTEAFVRLCDAGLIYRAESLVNWSCVLESAISDIEVDSIELPGPTLISVPGYENKIEFGKMFTFAYPVEGCDGEVAVSTTRPETMLGDVAVAVHPDDPRYQALQGKQCRHPFTNRLLPIIADALVDTQLGTGAVKVTPAHDHTDFLLSRKHSLPCLTVIGGDGTMTAACGPWLQGVKRFEARQLLVDALVEKKLFRGQKSHSMTLPVCSRSGDVIEPLLKKQWFVRCDQMSQRAIQAVEDGELQIIPHFYTKTWKNWLSNLSDWCVSRQLWWGHQIPAYQVKLPDSTAEQEEIWVCGRSEDEARRRAAVRCGVEPDAVTLTQDPDVLDTWFSSALFPFAMLGWPEQTADLQRFYPNSILETGSDLIIFWVARMVMLGTELTGQLPFKQVLLHPLVRDKHGRKMSKSLGNVINPLDVIQGVSLEMLQQKVKEGNVDPREQLVAMEAVRKDFPTGIPACGTDALRFSLCSHRLQGEDIKLSISEVLTSRTFCNKMWQTLRFTLGVLGDNTTPLRTLEETIPVSSMDQWICSRLYSTVVQCEQAFRASELHLVTSALRSFWIHSLCDVYLECVKPLLAPPRCSSAQMSSSVLFHCVSTSLALLSPFMPFITEELWQRLRPVQPGAAAGPSLCLQPYPSTTQLSHWQFPAVEKDFELVQELIHVARSLRVQCGMTKEKPAMWAVCSPSQARVLHRFGSAVQTLGQISSLHVCCSGPAEGLADPPPAGSLVGVVDHTCQLHLHVQGGTSVVGQMDQLSRRRDKLLPKLQKILLSIESPGYSNKVPAHIRQRMELKRLLLEQELKSIEEQMKISQSSSGDRPC
ncbi:valine--tRNA ligase, mitochondrial [Takifugu rubripes]|uniref:Valine--tRNA ligase, mitochondrial n=1 Tax=Takifugu rubripes TaxID=31033 RepID=H2SJP0_TAKRU|nr:valine--tRNA ligase, mitochondrial [Takifugu rubripes]